MSKKTTAPAVEVVRLDALKPNPLNRRLPRADDPKTIELADSMRSMGILQPLLVLPDNTIVAGHRRHVAARLAKLTEAPVLRRSMTEVEQLQAILVENLQREDFTPVQTGLTCKDLRDRGRTIAEIAADTGLGKGTVSKYLQVLELPEALQRAVVENELTLTAVPHLMKLPTEALRLEVGRKAAKEFWLAWEVERAVNAALGRTAKPAPASTPRPSPTAAATSAARPTGARPAPGSKAEMREQICELLTSVQRHPEYVNDLMIRDWIVRLSRAVNEAQKKGI